MPHILLENINNTKEAYKAITPFAQKTEDWDTQTYGQIH